MPELTLYIYGSNLGNLERMLALLSDGKSIGSAFKELSDSSNGKSLGQSHPFLMGCGSVYVQTQI